MMDEVLQDRILKCLVDYYIDTQVEPASTNEIKRYSELKEPLMGLGVSINSPFILRSIRAINSGKCYLDVSHMYANIIEKESWVPVDILEAFLNNHEAPFNDGVASGDGIIFGVEPQWLEMIGENPLNFKETMLYKNKLVSGEAKSEFFSLMHNIFGWDMGTTLKELVPYKGIGAGTTTQIAEQYLSAMLTGPFCQTKEYRLRKTKISPSLDVGHLLIYEAKLNSRVAFRIHEAGFSFAKVFNPKFVISDLVREFRDCYKFSDLSVKSLQDMFEITRYIVYGQNNGEKSVVCKETRSGRELSWKLR